MSDDNQFEEDDNAQDTPHDIVEDEERADAEPEGEPEPEETDEPEREEKQAPRTKSDDPKGRLTNAMRDKYRAINRANELEQALQQEQQKSRYLEQLRLDSIKTANSHYDNNVQLNLSIARENMKKAEEYGDVDTKLKAQEALAMAVSDAQQASTWRTADEQYMQQAQNALQQQQAPQYQPNIFEITKPLSTAWARENADWISPQSPRHDADLVQAVEEYTHAWNEQLEQNGRAHEIQSPDYMAYVQTHVVPGLRQHLHSQGRGRMAAPPRRNQPMTMGASSVSGVRPTSNRVHPSNLSAEQREAARMFGVSPAQYAKHIK